MLLTKTLHLRVPRLYQSRFNSLSHELKNMIEVHSQGKFIGLAEDFYENFCDFISEFYGTIEKNKLVYATQLIECFYTKWLDCSLFPKDLNTILEQTMAASISTLIIFNLAVQLSYISHYSLAVSWCLTLLSITVGIKITTAEWSSVGTLSGGLFKYKLFKTTVPYKNTHRTLKI